MHYSIGSPSQLTSADIGVDYDAYAEDYDEHGILGDEDLISDIDLEQTGTPCTRNDDCQQGYGCNILNHCQRLSGAGGEIGDRSAGHECSEDDRPQCSGYKRGCIKGRGCMYLGRASCCRDSHGRGFWSTCSGKCPVNDRGPMPIQPPCGGQPLPARCDRDSSPVPPVCCHDSFTRSMFWTCNGEVCPSSDEAEEFGEILLGH